MRANLIRLLWAICVAAMTGLSPIGQEKAPRPSSKARVAPNSPQEPPKTAKPSPAAARDTSAAKPGTGIIRGRVISAETGDPLRRARLVLSAPELDQPRYTATDAQGRYEFAGLPAARYTLTARKTPYVSLQFGQRRAFEAGTPSSGEAQRVAAKTGQVRAGIDVTLQPVMLGTLSGTLVDAGRGVPLLDARIRASAAASVSAAVTLFSETARAGGLAVGRIGTIRGDWIFELTNQLDLGIPVHRHGPAGPRRALQGEPASTRLLLHRGTRFSRGGCGRRSGVAEIASRTGREDHAGRRYVEDD